MTVSIRPDAVHVYRDSLGEWRWRRRAPGGHTISESKHGYRTYNAAIQTLRDLYGYYGYTLMTGTQ